MRIFLVLFSCVLSSICFTGCTSGTRPNNPSRVNSTPRCTSPDITTCEKPYLANAVDEYHVVVFSYNNTLGRVRPAETHTFATWVHSRNRDLVEQIDISWGPKDGGLRVVANEVPGRNKCLAETLKDAEGKKLAYWILRTDRSFFDAAAKQRDRLSYYKVLDTGTRPRAVNCIHACSDVAGYLETGTKCGIPAGEAVANFYVQQGKAWACRDEWVVPLINRVNACNVP